MIQRLARMNRSRQAHGMLSKVAGPVQEDLVVWPRPCLLLLWEDLGDV